MNLSTTKNSNGKQSKSSKGGKFSDSRILRESEQKMQDQMELAQITEILSRRQYEGLRLYLPLPKAKLFHKDPSKYRILVGANRSSKTLTASAELAMAFMGCDPYDKHPKKNGMALVVGLELDEIAMIWAKMTREGEFKLIPDEHTGELRAVRPNPLDQTRLDPYDFAYREKWTDAPPLIPERSIKSVAWEDKKKGTPRFAEFTSGWRSLWRSSRTIPPRGFHWNFVMLDEEMANPDFYFEAVRGLVGLHELPQHAPKLVWSATAQSSNPQLYDLQQKAKSGEERVSEYEMLFMENPYISDEEKAAFCEALTDEEKEVRVYGISAFGRRHVYTMFEPMGSHSCESFKIPDDWSRYVFLDPGRRHCGTAIIAIPPDEKHAYVVDVFEVQNGDADIWAHEIKERTGTTRFEAFVIDKRMGIETPVSMGENVATQYWKALDRVGIKPRMLGNLSGFYPGLDQPLAREEALIRWMKRRDSGPYAGTPYLQVFRGRFPMLERQIKHAAYDDKVPPKRLKLREDLLVAVEYAAAFNPRYRPPMRVDEVESHPVYEQYMRKLERSRPRSPGMSRIIR
jgi:hypothetical protein